MSKEPAIDLSTFRNIGERLLAEKRPRFFACYFESMDAISHLFMPFVHWLPKRPIRKWAIRGCIACGIEPRWDWLAAATPRTRAQAYYGFCNNETFYRRFREVRRSFNRFGLEVTPLPQIIQRSGRLG